MDYHSALRYLYNLVDFEKRRIERYSPDEFKLDRVKEFLAVLGNPQQDYPTIHIAGTKGKGSVSVMLASIARAAGLNVGLYTSPHLHTYRERIRINNTPISRDEMAALVTELQPLIEANGDLTVFEATTALGFLYFARRKVDLAVIEVGLGGRLDATNVILPTLSVITSLSLDHTHLLGNTLDKIAYEKGGIIKPQIPVVSAPQAPEAQAMLEELSLQRQAPLTLVGRDWSWEAGPHDLEGQEVTIHCLNGTSDLEATYHLPVIGAFQRENATVALAAADTLQKQGATWITPGNVRAGLARVSWPGRMEILSRKPLLLVDSAHNPYSAQMLALSLQEWFPNYRWIVLFGASNDKDIPGILEGLFPITEHIIVTRSYHPRAATPYELADICAGLGKGAEIAISPTRALEQAVPHLHPQTGILVTGSIFMVAEIRELWGKQHQLNLPETDWEDQPW